MRKILDDDVIAFESESALVEEAEKALFRRATQNEINEFIAHHEKALEKLRIHGVPEGDDIGNCTASCLQRTR